MKALVVYSSRTGNTKMVAEAIFESFKEAGVDCDLYSVADAPAPDGYDLICPGYWVDKGMPDADCLKYLERIKGKKIALFGTLGAYPDSEHGRDCVRKSEDVAAADGVNEIVGSFICMGKVDPRVIAMMQKVAQSQHPMTPERKARLEEGMKHPDQQDLENAKAAFAGFVRKLTGKA